MSVYFPHEICDFTTQGYGAAFPKKEACLNSRTVKIAQPTLKIAVKFKSGAKLTTFLSWWITSVEHGTSEFLITAPFFGIERDWNVKITSSNVAESISSGVMRNTTLDLILLEDLEVVLARYLNIGASTIIYTMDEVSTDSSGNRYLENEA